MIMAFNAYFGICSNNSAEALTLKTGFNMVFKSYFHRVTFEFDCLLIIYDS